LFIDRLRQCGAGEGLIGLEPIVGYGDLIGKRCGAEDLGDQRVGIECDGGDESL